MIKRSWAQTPALYTASYYIHMKITKIKVAEWGTSKKIKIKKINKIKTFEKGPLKKYMDFF